MSSTHNNESKTFSEKLGTGDGLIVFTIFIILAGILAVVTIVLIISFCKTRERAERREERPALEEPTPVEKPLSPGRMYLVEEQGRRSRISQFSTDFSSFYSDSHLQMRDIPTEAEVLPDNDTFKECPSAKGKRLSNRISILSAPSFCENPEDSRGLEETMEPPLGLPGTLQSDGSMLI